MSAVSRPLAERRTPTETHVVAYRGSVDQPGSLACGSCGSSSITKADFADDVGITINHLNRWLRRQPIPEPVAQRIRSKVLRVVE